MNERRGNLYLLTGLVIGLALGLLYGWVISPVQYMDTEPSSLAEAHKDQYRQLIALAYQANQNLGRARQRLALLDSENTISVLAAQAQRMVGDAQSRDEARALALLADDLNETGSEVSEVSMTSTAILDLQQTITEEALPEVTALPTEDEVSAILTPTVPRPTITPTVTETPKPTLTPRPSATPAPTLTAPFSVQENQEVCDPSQPAGLLQVYVTGLDGQPLPGVRVVVTRQDGDDSFYTGLAPEISPGYADFVMVTGEPYVVRAGEISEEAHLTPTKENCGWKLTFTQQGD